MTSNRLHFYFVFPHIEPLRHSKFVITPKKIRRFRIALARFAYKSLGTCAKTVSNILGKSFKKDYYFIF